MGSPSNFNGQDNERHFGVTFPGYSDLSAGNVVLNDKIRSFSCNNFWVAETEGSRWSGPDFCTTSTTRLTSIIPCRYWEDDRYQGADNLFSTMITDPA